MSIDPVVSVDPETGAKKQSKLARFDLIPAKALYELAERFGLGPASGRYGDNNWRGGYDWSLSYAALQRHASLFWSGEDYDKDAEKELPGFKGKHVIAIAWHALVLATFMDEQPDKDDRFSPKPREAGPQRYVERGEVTTCLGASCDNVFEFESPCSICESPFCMLCSECCQNKFYANEGRHLLPPLLDYKVVLTEDWAYFPLCDFMEVKAYEPEAAAIFFCQSTGQKQPAVITVIDVARNQEYRVEVGSRIEYYAVGRAEQICKKCGYA